MSEDIELYKRVRRGKQLYHEEKRRERRESFKNWFDRNRKNISKSIISLFLWGILITVSVSSYASIARQQDINSMNQLREDFGFYDFFNYFDVYLNHTGLNDTHLEDSCYTHIEQLEDRAKYILELDFSQDIADRIIDSRYVIHFAYQMNHIFDLILENQAVKEFYIEAVHYPTNYIRRISYFTTDLIVSWNRVDVRVIDNNIDSFSDCITLVEPNGFYSELKLVFDYHNLRDIRNN